MEPVTIAAFFFGLLLIVLVAAVVAAPLFRTGGALAAEAGGEREQWERRKRQALAAIKEAELDYQMGKLSEEDLRDMRSRFEAQALEAMAALEKGRAR